MNDLFAPCGFTNRNCYPHNIPDKAIEKLPSFQGNNAISVVPHVKNFNVCIFKWCNTANNEDVKMRLFVLSLEEDALDWFTWQPDNSYDSLQAIINAFMGKFGKNKENRHLINAISFMKKNENEIMEEFNKRSNDLVKRIPATIKLPDEFLLCSYLDAFSADTAYELRRKEPANLGAAQSEALKMERDRKESGKSEIPGFNRGPSKSHDSKRKAKEENAHDLIKELTQLIKTMEANHTTQMNAIQHRLVAMERNQYGRFQNRGNDIWQKMGPPNEHKPPNPLESTNLVDDSIPYCRPCDEMHDEATCPYVRRILEGGMVGTNEQINVVGKEHHLSMENWMGVVENRQKINKKSPSSHSVNNFEELDRIIELYGEKYSSSQILEIVKDRERERNKDRNQNATKIFIPPTSDFNIDLRGWINNAKILVLVTEILKISSQKLKLLKAIDAPHVKEMSNFSKDGCEDALIILQSSDMCRGNKDHQPFFITLLVNRLLLHNFVFNFGVSSCVMTKKVMNQLNLRISRP